MRSQITNSADFEKLESLEAPSFFSAIFHAVVVTVHVVYVIVVKAAGYTTDLLSGDGLRGAFKMASNAANMPLP